MSIKLMSAIFEAEMFDLPYTKNGDERHAKASTAKIVLLALADHANDYGESCFPGYDKMTIKTGLSRQGLADTYEALSQNGILTIRYKASRMGTNDYNINIRAFPKMSELWDDLPETVKPLDSGQSSHLTQTVKPLDHNHHITTKEPSITQKSKNSPITEKALDLKDNIPLEWRVLSGQSVREKDLAAARESQKDIPGLQYFTQYHADELKYAEPFAKMIKRGPLSKFESTQWKAGIKNAQGLKLTPQDLVDQITINWQGGLEVHGPQSVVKSASDRKAKEAAGVITKPKFEPKETYLPPTTAVFAED